MWDWIQSNSVDLFGHLLTLIGIIVGAIVLVWQIGRQHRSSLELQKRNAQEALKVEIYKTLTLRLRDVTRTNVTAMMYAVNVPSRIEVFQNSIKKNIPLPFPRERAIEFSHLHSAANDALIALIQEFEAWSIVFPEIELFQTALNSANHDARNASNELFNRFIIILPTDPPHDAPSKTPRPIPASPVSADQLSELERLVEEYRRAMDEIGCYVIDLQIEAQNKLLSGLFEHRVPRRKPLDSRFKVLSTEPVEMERLMSYFLNETSWGKEYKKYEAMHSKSAFSE
ncbi:MULTISPECIES: hypothetical protein [Marinobacter]|jgi:hypothetical protein|uniref:Uncharacterized protein n=2 Tax=Marinobacter TaxID=2742 RepID=A0A137SDS6_9GAMM|nr:MULTISPECIES: hypothetical protein [Marinobacter]AMQ90492.1 hypothetical protein ASQ50_18390 [Marinobacter sp. LQ44]KXO10584.1 hypothetical protein J122_1682 [Marinobacter excellens LAMA 842]MAO11712.1 hypothetical protein [Marinobacter sp.]